MFKLWHKKGLRRDSASEPRPSGTYAAPHIAYVNKTLLSMVDDGPGYSYAGKAAADILEEALRDDPALVEAHLELGRLVAAHGSDEECLRVYERFHKAVPDHAEAFVERLRFLVRTEKFEEAKKVYDEFGGAFSFDDVITKDVALALLREVIATKRFGTLSSVDFDNLFFIRHLLTKFNQMLRNVSFCLLDRFHHDYIALAHRYVSERGGRFVHVSVDDLFRVQNKSDTEKRLLADVAQTYSRRGKGNRINWLKSGPEHMDRLYCELPQYSAAYREEIFSGPKQTVQATRVVMSDWSSQFLNVVDGQRVTCHVPSDGERRLVLLGASDVYGFGCEDAHTIASFLQKRLLDNDQTDRVRVENHGARGNLLPVCLNNLFQLNVNAGDIVVLFGYPNIDGAGSSLDHVESHHISLSRPHRYGEIFLDQSHFAWTGNQAVADEIFACLFESDAATVEAKDADASGEALANAHVSIELLKYVLYKKSSEVVETGGLKDYVACVSASKVAVEGRSGSVAVNCNPFTLGHQHLLEYAAGQVDHLYVFVIEEDLSFFPYEDRLMLVKKGTAHLDNVTVLPGGRYICTELTFPEYFSKEDKNEVAADASMEAWFFCEFIAKALDISIIFLGDEPKCQITRQYNAKMLEILPTYGIEVDIIPRIGNEEGFISASTVRRYLGEKNFARIEQIVPETTFEYLKEKYADGARLKV